MSLRLELDLPATDVTGHEGVRTPSIDRIIEGFSRVVNVGMAESVVVVPPAITNLETE